jgi:guanine deaminase
MAWGLFFRRTVAIGMPMWIVDHDEHSQSGRCKMTDNEYLGEAIALAFENIQRGGRPFGAVVVRDGKVIARAVNRIDSDNDPTAHAELLGLRSAGQALGSPRLDGCVVYASGQPCPMCLAAMRMAGITEVYFAYSNEQAEPFGLSTAHVAAELAKPLDQQVGLHMTHCPPVQNEDQHLYRAWRSLTVPRSTD